MAPDSSAAAAVSMRASHLLSSAARRAMRHLPLPPVLPLRSFFAREAGVAPEAQMRWGGARSGSGLGCGAAPVSETLAPCERRVAGAVTVCVAGSPVRFGIAASGVMIWSRAMRSAAAASSNSGAAVGAAP